MTLDELVAARDAAVFVARERELGRLVGLLAPDSPHRLAFVTGPAGCGKSALLRELARRARALGHTPVHVDGRELTADPGRLGAVLQEAGAATRPLVLVDSAEELGPDERHLRDRELGRLPSEARVVLATRAAPEPAWWRSPWAASLLELPLGPLDDPAATAFLAARGVEDPTEVDDLVTWAEGHALSLTLAAAVRAAAGRPLAHHDLTTLETDLLDHLTGGRLASPELLGADRMVLAVAALAPAVDATLLEAVLPGCHGPAAERWLRSLPFAERLGHRVTLHQRVRRLVAAELRRVEPHLERDLRLRTIDHLTVAAQAGHPQLVIDIREVLDPPEDRGVTPSMALASSWRVETATAADAAVLRALGGDEDPAYLDWLVQWVLRAPEHVIVVRPPDGGLAALAVWATPETVPTGMALDPVLGAWLERAAAWGPAGGPGGGTLLNPVVEVLVDDRRAAEVGALLLTSLVQRCGLPNFRRWVVPRKGRAPDPAHCGGQPEPSLDLRFGEVLIETYVIDYGAEGVIPALRAQAHQQLAPRASAVALAAAPGSDVVAVREVLRSFHEPLRLAASPLAVGDDPAARAASVVALVRDAVEHAFGDTQEARLQREVLERGYLDREAGHARAMRTLHLSRTTYFRRLREATATVAAWVATRPPG